jgi:hypothetical protein
MLLIPRKQVNLKWSNGLRNNPSIHHWPLEGATCVRIGVSNPPVHFAEMMTVEPGAEEETEEITVCKQLVGSLSVFTEHTVPHWDLNLSHLPGVGTDQVMQPQKSILP